MNRALKTGVSKHPLLMAIAVAGILSLGVMTTQSVKSAEPDSATPSHEHDHMGRCAMMSAYLNRVDKKLSPEQVHDIVAGRLAQFGEGTLKVGKVATKEAGVVSVEIDTLSGSMVTTREISTKTGLPAGIEKRCEEHAGRMADHAEGHGSMDHDDGGRREGGFHGHMMAGFGGMGLVGGGRDRDLNLSTDQVKKLADAALILAGNPRLKVGPVKEKDGNTVTVDIVTVDNALVLHREVDRHSGHVHRAI